MNARLFLFPLFLLGAQAGFALGVAPKPANAAVSLDARDRAILKTWKKSVLKLSNFTAKTDGEGITWHVSPYLRGAALMAEALGGDRECLDMFCRGFEHLMSITSTDIDGLLGWPTKAGSYGREGPRCIIMDEAIICRPVGIFGRILKQHPELEKDYGQRYRKYMDFVEQKLFPKWKSSWLDLKEKALTLKLPPAKPTGFHRAEVALPEPAGVYRFYTKGKKAGMSLPLNQFLAVVEAYLAFYDATGKKPYLDKVTKMARAAKYIYLEPVGNRVDPWYYWRPVYAGDFKSENEGVHWHYPHPHRASYASMEVSVMAELHRRKIVFTDADMQRLVRLHLDLQWNKDLANPKFDYKYRGKPNYQGKLFPAKLWTPLAPFDSKIAQMAAKFKTRQYIQSMAGRWAGIGSVPAYFQRKFGSHGTKPAGP